MVHVHHEVGWGRPESLSWCWLRDLHRARLSGPVPPLLTEETRASTEQLKSIPRVCGAGQGVEKGHPQRQKEHETNKSLMQCQILQFQLIPRALEPGQCSSRP